MIKRAMILAAGFGKRVLPLTAKRPKALLKIGKETLLSNTLKFLQSFGIEEVVINVHYLGEEIIEYINNNNFDLNIKIVEEKKKILDTGGGVLNAINNFSREPFVIINPDTIWNSKYLKELKEMEKIFIKKKNKCLLLVVKNEKSFDKSFTGDFNFKKNLIFKKNSKNLNYTYTGLQIVKSDIFLNMRDKIFSINKIWDKLILEKNLYAFESNIDFFHVSTLNIYKKIIKNIKN